MTIKELLNEVVDKKLSYPEAKERLKKMKLPYSEEESYDVLIKKMCGGYSKKVWHEPVYNLPIIPNEMYHTILQDSIKQVRQEKYSPEIAQDLYDKYMLGPGLINYFLNESISAVRMNTLTEEEIHKIGSTYYKAMQFAKMAEQMRPKRKRPKLPEGANINAIQAGEIDMIDMSEEYIDEEE